MREGTMPCMPQHPKVVPCSGPGAQEGLRRPLLTLNASRSQGALPVPPASLLSLPLCANGCQGYLLSCSCSAFSSPSCSFSSCSWCWACSLAFWSLCLRLWGRDGEKEGKRKLKKEGRDPSPGTDTPIRPHTMQDNSRVEGRTGDSAGICDTWRCPWVGLDPPFLSLLKDGRYKAQGHEDSG